jgi:Na+-translocating ferredoxin:NAD+ oxidoreductase subunit D
MRKVDSSGLSGERSRASTAVPANGAEVLPSLQAASAPHLFAPVASTQRMMWDVILGLSPVIVAAIWHFRLAAVQQMVVAIGACLVTEWLFCRLRGRPSSLWDGSVAITGLILALSLPPQLPLPATLLGSFVAVSLGKVVFGGLGSNIFNPAMVGRAFLMACFPAAMTVWMVPATADVFSGATWSGAELLDELARVDATTGATPLSAAKYSGETTELWRLSWGLIPGSVGETCTWAILLGGAWVLYRRAADWRLTTGMLLAVGLAAAGHAAVRGQDMLPEIARQWTSGAVMLGAFFIVTDPVTSPLTRSGRWTFGLLVGTLTMIIRLFSGYPEGVMFAVLLGNALTPLINHWTRPLPVGGPVRWTSSP